MKYTAEQLVKLYIINTSLEMDDLEPDWGMPPDEVEEYYDEMGSDSFYEAKYECREGECSTDVPCDYSRYYESRSVAACINGQWVGWTYWYGGGKHGEPEAIDWVEDAYLLDCREEEKLVVVREFKKVGE